MGKVMRMSDRGAENVFARLRWPTTDGKPVCPSCGCTTLPPVRLFLGDDALQLVEQKLVAMREEIAAWEALSRSTRFAS